MCLCVFLNMSLYTGNMCLKCLKCFEHFLKNTKNGMVCDTSAVAYSVNNFSIALSVYS